MNTRFLLSFIGVLTFSSLAYGDIQAPPASHWTWSRKLSRSLANIAYGSTELPTTWNRIERTDGVNAAFSGAIVDGSVRSVVRLGYGLFELVTFPFPAYKGGYRPPFHKKDSMDHWRGYEEFPPQLGFLSQSRYCRTQQN